MDFTELVLTKGSEDQNEKDMEFFGVSNIFGVVLTYRYKDYRLTRTELKEGRLIEKHNLIGGDFHNKIFERQIVKLRDKYSFLFN